MCKGDKQLFNLEVPMSLDNFKLDILDPRNTYENVSEWNNKAVDLASRFIENFKQYTDNKEGLSLVNAGPQIHKIQI